MREDSMQEDTGSRAGRSKRLRSPAGEGDAARWWPPDSVFRHCPEELLPVVRALAAGLSAEEGEEAEPPAPAESLDPERVWRGAAILREAILEAGAQGASPEALGRLHRRLDRQAGRLAGIVFSRLVSDSRRLLEQVSHDIRSPLNSILFLADTLLNEHSGELNPVQRRQLGVLYTAAVTLVNLVNDLIDASRLVEGHEISVSHVSFSLEACLNDVRSLLRPLASHRGVDLRFQLETLGPRSGDRQLLSRILINLITNAVQAVDEGGNVEVRVTEPREGWLRLEVRDDGPGGDVERLRRYVEVDTEGTYPIGQTSGWTHGLGLTITSRLVRATGGTLEVESEAGEGTTFATELPFPAGS